jgi:hypothetical protein
LGDILIVIGFGIQGSIDVWKCSDEVVGARIPLTIGCGGL